MEKNLILILFFLVVFQSFCFAEIIDYKVPNSVSLGLTISVTGKSIDENLIAYSNQLCSFYFLDSNGNLIDRATDQYTDQTGRFSSYPFYVNEPYFKRGSDYNILSVCGGNEATQSFRVGQMESIEHLGSQTYDYITNPNNTFTAFIWFFIILTMGSVFGFFWWYKKQWGKK